MASPRDAHAASRLYDVAAPGCHPSTSGVRKRRSRSCLVPSPIRSTAEGMCHKFEELRAHALSEGYNCACGCDELLIQVSMPVDRGADA